MKPRRQTSPTINLLTTIFTLIALAFCLLSFKVNVSNAQGQVQVSASDPMAAELGTINLNVKVTGKGFKNGAKAKWFVTGTTDTGGVTVNSTTFVSSSELTANITVDDAATIATFDIQVTNSDGRGGKGTELFKVIAKAQAQAACPAMQPAPTSDTKCYGFLPGCLDSTFAGVGYVHNDLYPAYVSSADGAEGVVVQPDGKIIVAGRTRISFNDIEFTLIRYNVDGTLDTSFGDPEPSNPPFRRGYTLTALTSGFDYVYSMVLQPDGKILVSGFTDESVVVRYNANGTLDTGFGGAGIAHLGPSAPARDVALQSNGKIVIGGAAGGGFGLVRLNANGSLDSSFGSGGTVTANPAGGKRGSGHGWYIAIQRVPAVSGEERIVVAGWSKVSNGATSDWTVMRFRSNGAIDTSFGTSGIVKTYFSGFGDQARNVLIDSNNRIVVAGIIRSANDSCGSYVIDAAVVRYTQDGGLDGTFSGGKQIVDVYGGDDSLYAAELQPDGKILLFDTARSSDGSETHFAVVRFNADGSRDSSFGLQGNGVVTTDLFGTESWAKAGALDPTSGKIVVVGSAYLIAPFSQGEFAVARYLP